MKFLSQLTNLVVIKEEQEVAKGPEVIFKELILSLEELNS